jgi:hypothetical protein
MKRLAVLACALHAALALADAPPKAEAVAVSAALEPAKMHEECVRMEAGDKRMYHWKSSAAVDFNIHYHRGTEVFYPVKRDGMRGDGGTFVAKTGEDLLLDVDRPRQGGEARGPDREVVVKSGGERDVSFFRTR